MNKYLLAYRRQQVIPHPPPRRDSSYSANRGAPLLPFVVAFTPKVQGEENNIPSILWKAPAFGAHKAPGPAGSSGERPPGATLASGAPVAPLPNFLGWKKSFLLPVKETRRLLRGSCCQRESSRLFIPHRRLPEDPGPGAGPDAPWICQDGLSEEHQECPRVLDNRTPYPVSPAFAQLWVPRLKTKAHQHNYSPIGLSFK